MTQNQPDSVKTAKVFKTKKDLLAEIAELNQKLRNYENLTY
jgi:hypothetical protein